MIPIQLTLEGIYSYQKRQTIDFNELTEAGLFGIFGAVASGKSTILEAISFSLYGESDRMNINNRAYNMMNLKSNRMYIEFDFWNFENKKFRAVRELRRNSKKFEDVRPEQTTFYEWINEDWQPLEHCNAELIIGLSAANFKRTIIIPQGKFKEFIELGGKDRTSMMKEIFNLYHFDLYNNVRTLYNSNEEKLNTLTGKLSGYEEVSEETIDEKSKHYIDQIAIFNQQLELHKQLGKTYDYLKQLSLDFNKLEEEKVRLASEETNKKLISESEVALKRYIDTHQQFEEILKLKKQLCQKIEKEDITLRSIAKELILNQKESDHICEKLVKLKPFINTIEISKEKTADLELIRQIIINKTAIKSGEESTKKGRNYVEQVSKEKSDLTDNIEETEHKIEEIKGKLLDPKTLTSIELWFSTYNILLKQNKEKQAKLDDLTAETQQMGRKFQELDYTKDNWKETIDKESEELNSQLDQSNNNRNKLEVKKQIAHFTNELKNGHACPLCGSLEHPHVIENEDISTDVLENETMLKSIEEQLRLHTKRNSELIKLQAFVDSLNKNTEVIKAELEKEKEEKEQHLLLFEWENFSFNDEEAFKYKKDENDLLSNRKDELEKKQKANRNSLNETIELLEKAAKRLALIESENSNKKALIEADKKRIKHLLLDDYENQTVDSVEKIINEQKLEIQTKQEEYSSLEKKKNMLLLSISAQKATIAAIEKQIAQLSEEQKENDTIVNSRLSETYFESIAEIEQLLNNKIDVEAERKRIEDFKINYAQLEKSIKDLEERLEGKSFSMEEFENEKLKFEESEKALNLLREQVATLKHDLDRIEKEYREKKELLSEKEKLDARKLNISTLSQLFKGSGFVNYVSSIYLRNLCEIANKRFHRLTKNQLSLQINDKNEFEIIDYLNDGHTRSVRTLSGGQSFQVSLSLALALAENVQSLTNADKNFFFIDEGFGTQDAESVNIVFETLSNLQKENRIVGIISHVEELQERIPKSLYIKNDLEKGSLIEVAE